ATPRLWPKTCAVPEGTRFNTSYYPALRLRLRAGLSCSAPTALVFLYSYSPAEPSFSCHSKLELSSRASSPAVGPQVESLPRAKPRETRCFSVGGSTGL